MSVLSAPRMQISIPADAIEICANRFRQHVADGSMNCKTLETLEVACLELIEKSSCPTQKTINMAFMQGIRMARKSIAK